MRVVSSIDQPLQDEHVLTTDPPIKPELPGVWLRRINPFTGRSLTATALTAEQDARGGRLLLRGQALSSGPVEGLDVRAESGWDTAAPGAAVLQISAGLGIAQSGEDVTVLTPRRLRLADIPVFARVDWLDSLPRPDGAAPPPVADTGDGVIPPGGAFVALPPLAPRRMGGFFGTLIGGAVDALLPRVAVLVAEPVTAELAGRGDPSDPCPRDPGDDAYEDWLRIDGCRLSLYFWPSELVAARAASGYRPPDYALPPAGPAYRNALAYSIFAMERGFLPGEIHPWERLGVPLALIGFTPDWHLQFVDRAAVARLGGLPNPRTPAVLQAGSPFLWQARVSQFVEHLADLDLATLTPTALAGVVRQLPPVGLLPVSAIDPTARTQSFFPIGFGVRAVPVATEDLELAISESASLMPFNLDVPDAVEIAVPVPERVYDPDLLQTAAVDPAFQRSITALTNERTDWHVRRELVRRKRDVLVDAVTGTRPSYPEIDPDELPDERLPNPAGRAPVSASRTRLVVAGAAFARHDFIAAQSSLSLIAGDRLFVWVRIVPGAVPGGIALAVGLGAEGEAGDWTGGVYWGVRAGMTDFNADAAAEPRRQGALPPVGQWTRLIVSADAIWRPNDLTLAGETLDGLGFEQMGGTVEWGPAGKLDRSDNETVYLSDEAPAGSTLWVNGEPATWPWQFVDPADRRPVEDDYGTRIENDTLVSGALADLRDRWPQPWLSDDFADLTEFGVDGFSSSLQLKLKTTNDAIDLGFVRARSDIYRVRQYMLGSDAASRLVTSPTLADLSVRDESARAKSADIQSFLTQAYQTNAARDPSNPMQPATATTAVTPIVSAPSGAVAVSQLATNRLLSASALNIASTAFKSTATARISTAAQITSSFTPIVNTQLLSTIVSPTLSVNTSAARIGTVSTITPVSNLLLRSNAATLRLNGEGVPVTSLAGLGVRTGVIKTTISDVQAQNPLVGFTERTASVAERLQDPPAVEAQHFALEGKRIVRESLFNLLRLQARTDQTSGTTRPGIAIGDLPVPGFALKAGVTPAAGRTAGTLADLMDHDADHDDLDIVDDGTARHEADYFAAAVKALDNTIALMRLVEGRIDLYNGLSADAQTVRSALSDAVDAAEARLRAIEIEIVEVRQDLSVATALLAEDQARVDALNAQRTQVLQNNVKFLLFRRPRSVDRDRVAPTSRAGAALAESPVVTCLRDHSAIPDELRSMAALFREAPVRWWPPFFPHLVALDTVDSVRNAFASVQRRTQIVLPLLQQAPSQPASAPKYLAAATRVRASQQASMAALRTTGLQLNLGALSQTNLTAARDQLLDAASLGDLMDGNHGRPELGRQAAQFVEQIAQVAACLNASFGDAAPIIRLGWADKLSQFDAPVPLQSLSILPRWNELPIDQRREQQAFVDYLFSRIDSNNATASGTMSDLVRVAVLMASHAPVDKIVSARVAASAPARVGGKIMLNVDVSQIRLGMSVLVRGDKNTVTARGVVEDIVGGVAHARITQAANQTMTIGPTALIHLTNSTLLKV